jgi:hypothetical protein
MSISDEIEVDLVHDLLSVEFGTISQYWENLLNP